MRMARGAKVAVEHGSGKSGDETEDRKRYKGGQTAFRDAILPHATHKGLREVRLELAEITERREETGAGEWRRQIPQKAPGQPLLLADGHGEGHEGGVRKNLRTGN